MRGGETADPVVINYAQQWANNGRAMDASSMLYTAATLPIGVVRAPAAASTALYGSSAPRVFWSGKNAAGVSVMGPAAAYARRKGIRTLEMTNAGRALEFSGNTLKTGKSWHRFGVPHLRVSREAPKMDQ